MNIEFNEVFASFKKLNQEEKMKAIIDFIKKDIKALNQLNIDIGNNLDSKDIETISNISFDDKLDAIYKLLHILTEQFELFSEKISQEFYE